MSEGLRRATTLAMAAGALWLATHAEAESQSWRTLTSARQFQGEPRLDVKVDYGAGTMRVGRVDGGRLYAFELRYDEENFTPVTEFDRASGALRLGVEGRGGRGSLSRGEGSQARAVVQLTPEVPVALELRFGAGEARLDLGGMALESLDLSTGASETTIRFDAPNRIPAEFVRIRAGAAALRAHGLGNSGASRFEFDGGVGETVLDFSGGWSRDASASVKMGIGSLRLRFPRALGVRISRSSFLTSFDSEGLVRRGSEFYSPNWEQATHRLTLEVNAAFGSIGVEWID